MTATTLTFNWNCKNSEISLWKNILDLTIEENFMIPESDNGDRLGDVSIRNFQSDSYNQANTWSLGNTFSDAVIALSRDCDEVDNF